MCAGLHRGDLGVADPGLVFHAGPRRPRRLTPRPTTEIVLLPRTAADAALLGSTGADLTERAQEISSGTRYELRVHGAGQPAGRAITAGVCLA
ncbi:hypothetical protein AB0O51_35850 [Streptomyces sp. NPDC090301]|uniref:hypothetical protein n=1 Tax=Streptomyces sp. NPDC090301 TaxID=3154975 RepID=UPI0034342795